MTQDDIDLIIGCVSWARSEGHITDEEYARLYDELEHVVCDEESP